MCLRYVVSGGQTGADQAGLRAAKACGLKTGGYMPKGFFTEDGNSPFLGVQYGLVETDTSDYLERTELNVMISDGTVVFGNRSRGSNLTEELCRQQGKPCLWLKEYQSKNAPMLFRLWLRRNKVVTLNVAGNRESRSRGIGVAVERFLIDVLPSCK